MSKRKVKQRTRDVPKVEEDKITPEVPEENTELTNLEARQEFLLATMKTHETERWPIPSNVTVELEQINSRIAVIKNK